MLYKITQFTEYNEPRGVVLAGLDPEGRHAEVGIPTSCWRDFKKANPTTTLPFYIGVTQEGSVALISGAAYNAAAGPHRARRYEQRMARELLG